MTIAGYEFALVGKTRVHPRHYRIPLYHGSDRISITEVMDNGGLPAKGKNLDLIRHAEPLPGTPPNDSAFRGATVQMLSQERNAGATLWANGGTVFLISDFPGYDLSELLDGRIPDGKGGYRGLLMTAELEVAIPARVPIANMPYFGEVNEANLEQQAMDWKFL